MSGNRSPRPGGREEQSCRLLNPVDGRVVHVQPEVQRLPHGMNCLVRISDSRRLIAPEVVGRGLQLFENILQVMDGVDEPGVGRLFRLYGELRSRKRGRRMAGDDERQEQRGGTGRDEWLSNMHGEVSSESLLRS